MLDCRPQPGGGEMRIGTCPLPYCFFGLQRSSLLTWSDWNIIHLVSRTATCPSGSRKICSGGPHQYCPHTTTANRTVTRLAGRQAGRQAGKQAAVAGGGAYPQHHTERGNVVGVEGHEVRHHGSRL